MKMISTMAAQPLTWLTLLGVLVLFLPVFSLSYWCISNKTNEHKIHIYQHQTRWKLMYDIHNTMKLFPTIESRMRIVTILNATLKVKELNFSIFQTKVAPILFQALVTNPNLAQISFIGIDGLFFSFSTGGDGINALYANGTSASRRRSSSTYKWYTQPVSNAGELIGEARITAPPPAALNSTVLLSAINSTSYSSVGSGWSDGSELLFLNTVPVGRSIGVISLGVPVKLFSDYFSAQGPQGGGLYVETNDGVVVAAAGVISNTSAAAEDRDRDNLIRVVESNDHRNFPFGGLSCKPVDKITLDSDPSSMVEVWGKQYEFYCSTIDLAGVPSVYVLAFPSHGLVIMIHGHNRSMLILLSVSAVVVAAFVVSFMSLAVLSTRQKMRLNAQLIKQMETTQQAEKKSINKSMAIATTSHDVRAALSAIIGLIDLCFCEVTHGSELEESLQQMNSCANDLLALLNSILDTSKIEAGKMQLQETEFNLAQLLEDLADMYHPVGMKKGVEVVLDPCDGSVYAFSNVRGDYGKLKQILSNLLSNAVKFTKEGHVSIRAWARKFSFESSVMEDSSGIISLCCCSSLCLFQEQVKRDIADLQDSTKTKKMDPNCFEFVFEVDDTGVGIPKEKRKSVFQNFEQVKDAAADVGGTGLGLGIVRSLVQLMGGDIEIMDKSSNRGTCFRFNIFLVACDHQRRTLSLPSYNQSNRLPNVAKLRDHDHSICNDSFGSSGQDKAPPPSPNNTDGSLVVLLIRNKGRRKMIQRFLETQGIRVMVAKEAKFLPSILKKVKNKLIGSSFNSSSDLSPRYCFSNSSSTHREDSKNFPLTALDGANETVPVLQRRPNLLGICCILLIIDANVGEFSDLRRRASDFQKELGQSKCCKVVWLEKPETRNLHFQRNNEQAFPQADDIFIKPLHGSRLFQVIGHLPEFGGQVTKASPKRKRNNTTEVGSALDPDMIDQKWKSKNSVATRIFGEIEEIGSSSSGRSSTRQRSPIASLMANRIPVGHRLIGDASATRIERPAATTKRIETASIAQRTIPSSGSTSSEKPLLGKKILIVEDNEVQKRVAAKNVSRMGAASVETCKNGKEALDIVCKALKDQAVRGSLELPFHFILMDCQMPEMDGFKATRRIRNEEAKYGLRIPIFALTAHDSGEICERMFEAGMDAHLERPLREDQLVEAIRSSHLPDDA